MSSKKKPNSRKAPPGKRLIFRPWITTKDGRRIYPKNGRVFPIWVDA